MKHKSLLKIIFDIVAIILFALLYNTSVTGFALHELIGLIFCGIVIIHLAYNWKWILAVSKRFFKKGYSGNQRVKYVVNLLSLISFILTTVSGIMISRVFFSNTGNTAGFWLSIHIISALFLLFMLAVHLGLHWGFVFITLKRYIKIPTKITSILKYMLTSIVIVLGVYGSATLATVIEKTYNIESSIFHREYSYQREKRRLDFANPADLAILSIQVVSITVIISLPVYFIEEYNKKRKL